MFIATDIKKQQQQQKQNNPPQKKTLISLLWPNRY